MRADFFTAIQAHYNLEIISCVPGPRQFVADTYVLGDANGTRYFCKIVTKPLFVTNLVAGLAAVAEMHERGIERICYPIRGESGFHVIVGGAVIVLYNYIPLPQSEVYSLHAFGKLLAEIHAVSPRVHAATPTEDFVFGNRALFEEHFERYLGPSAEGDVVSRAMRLALSAHEDEIRRFYARFLELGELCRQEPFEAVLTHDDAPGNVLIRSPEDLYIIDWDGIQRAPAERDTWLVDHFPEFLRGYRSVRPHFVTHTNLRSYAILSYYFQRLVYIFAEVVNETRSFDSRVALAEGFETDMLNGWMTPKLKEVWQ